MTDGAWEGQKIRYDTIKNKNWIPACPRKFLSGAGMTGGGLQVTLPKIVRILYMSVIDVGDGLPDEGDSG
jgi:hypothetical protein